MPCWRTSRSVWPALAFPSEIEGSGWDYGTNLAYLRELVTYWRTTFDWRAQERKLNQLPQFKTQIEGLDLHFIHKKSSRADAVPLVFVHGWPGSIVEVTKIIGPLTEPPPGEVAFHVVAISLPGYGFSDKPKQGGVSNRRIAGMIAQLMARLGYQRYGAQGGDWGGFIVRQLGLLDPQHLIGVHSNMCVTGPPPGPDPNAGVPPEELKRVDAARARALNESAYSQLQGTKPQTLGYSLNDSPAGLAAWIVEKFRTWSDSGGDVEKKFTKDELLTNIMIYWATETGPSSVRLYYENRRDPGLQGKMRGAVRLRGVPVRDVRHHTPPMGGGEPQPGAVHRDAARRALRGDGRAGAARRGCQEVLQGASVAEATEGTD